VKKFLLFVALATASQAATSTWLDQVAPIITPAQKKLYLSLRPEARERFEQEFWADKAITAQEYFERLQYIDANFGSSKVGSGANTDPGRVYLSLGPPNRVTRLPSSRIFFPIEIWYYDTVPGLLNTELRLIFFQKNGIGLMKLYSPTQDTIRALLIPQAPVQDTFGPNDDLTESDIRKTLMVPTAEDEIIPAAVNVATGIYHTGNDEILGKIASPALMLGKSFKTDVKSKFITSHPKLDILETVSPYGGFQIDLGLDTVVQRDLQIQVLGHEIAIYQNDLHLKFDAPQEVRYTHRLDLLPGSYRIIFTVDGTTHPYALEVKEKYTMSEIVRADPGGDSDHRLTPFEFEGKQLDFNPAGKFAIIAVRHPGKVNWTLRKNWEIVWKSTSDANQIAILEPPTTGFEPGTYKLEASFENETRIIDYVINNDSDKAPPSGTILSFNANLAPALRLASIGHQWLLRGNFDQALSSLQASLAAGPTREANIEMARLDAAAGRYDDSRNRLRRILASQPNDFDALSVLAFVEASLQDYPVAAELYRRALAIQDSPAIRLALSKLPQK
jgi:GWxTD domain-containing protein